MSSDIRDETADDGLTAEQVAASDPPLWPSSDPIIEAARKVVTFTTDEAMGELRIAVEEYDEGAYAFERWINEVPI